jgi:hypothetical protein
MAEIFIPDGDVIFANTLELHSAIVTAIGKKPTYKVAALASGYTVEFSALSFQEITRLQASSLDAFAARMKLLRTLYGRATEFSCGPLRFDNWLKISAQADYDTLMYGMYAATYPGENEFDIACRHCQHPNKVTADVNSLIRLENKETYGAILELLNPKADWKGAVEHSMVGHTVNRRLPKSGIVATLRAPSLQDTLEGTQWFVGAADKQTGALPPELSGADTIRTLVMYTSRFLVPRQPGSTKYLQVTDAAQRAQLIGSLCREDGIALTAAIDAETQRLAVSYRLPEFNCAGCGKRNTDLFLNFENLLFLKLQESA